MAKRSRSDNIAINASAGVIAKIINIITGFVMRTVFIHTIGIAYTGISGLFTDVMTMLSFAELGISGAITYALYKPVAQNDHEHVAMLMNFYKKAYRIVALVVMVVGLCFVPFLGIIVPADKIGGDAVTRDRILSQLTTIYILYVINTAVSYLLIYKTSLLTAHQEQRYVSFVQICISIARVAVECAILFGLKNYEYCFIIYLIAGIFLSRLQNAISSHVATKRHPEMLDYGNAQLPREERKSLYKNVGALMAYKVCNSISASVDSVVVSAMFGSLWIGFVSNYQLVTTKLTILINQFYTSASPSIGNMVTDSDSDKQYSTFKGMYFLTFWIQCFCATSLVVLLNPFVEIWLGAEYVKIIWIPIALVVADYLTCMLQPVTAYRTTNGLFTQGWFRPIAMLALKILFSVMLAYVLGSRYGVEWGIVGVKVATAIARLCTIQWFDPWLIYRRVFHKPVGSYFRKFALYTSVTAASAVITYFLGTLITRAVNSTGVSFILLMLLCVVIPNGIVYLLFRKTKEFGMLMGIAGKVLGKLKKKIKA